MRGEANLGKSIPVVEFRAETILAPLTPEKPIVIEKAAPICPNGQYHNAETEDYLSRFTLQNQGEFSMASKVIGSSSSYDAGGWVPLYRPPTGISEIAGSSNSVYQENSGSMNQWGGMSFSDLLALNHGLGFQMINDYAWNLDYHCPSTPFMSADQERMGIYGGSYKISITHIYSFAHCNIATPLLNSIQALYVNCFYDDVD
ncbi:hypothetical protein V2J09_010671 [Rumex salicifolius]